MGQTRNTCPRHAFADCIAVGPAKGAPRRPALPPEVAVPVRYDAIHVSVRVGVCVVTVGIQDATVNTRPFGSHRGLSTVRVVVKPPELSTAVVNDRIRHRPAAWKDADTHLSLSLSDCGACQGKRGDTGPHGRAAVGSHRDSSFLQKVALTCVRSLSRLTPTGGQAGQKSGKPYGQATVGLFPETMLAERGAEVVKWPPKTGSPASLVTYREPGGKQEEEELDRSRYPGATILSRPALRFWTTVHRSFALGRMISCDRCGKSPKRLTWLDRILPPAAAFVLSGDWR